MIQRIQSIYLLLSTAIAALCLFIPLGSIVVGDGMNTVYKYGWSEPGSTFHVLPAMSGVILSCIVILNTMCVWSFKKRMLQIRYINITSMLIVAFYLMIIILTHFSPLEGFTPDWSTVLPFTCYILNFLSKKAIIKDENMVRAADRIR